MQNYICTNTNYNICILLKLIIVNTCFAVRKVISEFWSFQFAKCENEVSFCPSGQVFQLLNVAISSYGLILYQILEIDSSKLLNKKDNVVLSGFTDL